MKYKNCLTCKYEPEWSDETGFYTAHLRRVGECKLNINISTFSAAYKIKKEYLTWYKYVGDKGEKYIHGHGLPKNCPAWRNK